MVLNPIDKPRFGTTLIAARTADGILMAADDLMYAQQGGNSVPIAECVQKVFISKQNILIGTAGVMSFPQIKYEAQDWIAAFINAQHADTFQRPSDIASALHVKMRDTFKPIASSLEEEVWQSYTPAQSLVSYFVAGYAESFQRPYFFEIGTEMNSKRDGLVYLSPMRKDAELLWIGEDQFWQRAVAGQEPQFSARNTIVASLAPAVPMPEIPTALSEVLLSVVSLIKVEGQFNSNKVGQRVAVALIDRTTRTPHMLTY